MRAKHCKSRAPYPLLNRVVRCRNEFGHLGKHGINYRIRGNRWLTIVWDAVPPRKSRALGLPAPKGEDRG